MLVVPKKPTKILFITSTLKLSLKVGWDVNRTPETSQIRWGFVTPLQWYYYDGTLRRTPSGNTT